MKEYKLLSIFRNLIFIIFSICLCQITLEADYLPSDPAYSQTQNYFYSLDEPIDDLKSTCLQSAVSMPTNAQPSEQIGQEKTSTQPSDSSQQFYPNLFQNNLFSPQPTDTNQPALPQPSVPTTANQPSAESLSTPVESTPVSQPAAPSTQNPAPSPAPSTPTAIPPALTPTPQAPATPTAHPPTITPTPVAPPTPTETPIFPSETAPTVPAIPVTPTVPATPVVPTTPAVPGTPTVPAVPAVPTNPTPSIVQPNAQAPVPSPIFQSPTNPAPQQIQALNPPPPAQPQSATNNESSQKTILINFNNVAITEYIRFVSRISNKNFVFDENDLQFTVTIVSEEPTTIENIMTALLQEMRIHNLDLIEQDNTIIIHRNSKVTGISKVVPEDANINDVKNADIVTKVFRLNTLEADRAAIILRPMVSAAALVEVLRDTNHLIITDLASNIREISALLKSLDSPQSGLVIGQYVVTSQPMDALIAIGQKIIQSIAQDQKVIFIPHRAANSIFVVSNPYLVERTISILKYLDQTAATTQILNPKNLNFPTNAQGQWILDQNGNWQFIPGSAIHGGGPPRGNWKIDDQGNWYFEPGEPTGGRGPDGKWVLDKNGNWVFQLTPGKSISPQTVQRKERISSELPVGHIERTQFSLYKLQYRRGEQIAKALSRVAESLAASAAGTNADLLAAIYSVQWIESSNSLIFTGTVEAVTKMNELIEQIDTPLRQVLLEMLIIETDITDSLNFSTNVAARFGGGNTAGAEAFLSGASTLPAGIASSGVSLIPDAGGQIAGVTGFVLGVIGQTITHNGTEFATLGALVKALHTRTTSKIIMNPKILTEDNSPAEVFVGLNTQFPTQSIANNLGTILTQNFEFRDVGTTLKVTPMIGNNDIVTLEIQEEVSSIVSGGVTSSTTLTNQVIGPTTKINRTTTKVHLPNRFFLILSGMLSDTEDRTRTQVPCLGSVPVIGAAFSDTQYMDSKQNVLIFIHPIIIDTQEEIDNITRHEQNIYRVKNRILKDWVEETHEAMDFFNIIDTENSDGTEDCY